MLVVDGWLPGRALVKTGEGDNDCVLSRVNALWATRRGLPSPYDDDNGEEDVNLDE